MTGLVLAAGAGRRLRPHTDTLPERGFTAGVAPARDVTWVENDNHESLALGREITCRY